MRRQAVGYKYIAVLAAACSLILLVGGMLRPRTGESEAATPSVTADILQFERSAQRRDVEHVSDYFAYVATLVEESVVLLSLSGQSGIVWQAGEVVTSSRIGPFPARDRTALGTRAVDLETKRSAPNLPYVLLAAPLDAAVSDRRPVRLYRRGAWVLAAWRSAAGGLRYAPGNLFGVADVRCGELELAEVQTNLDLGRLRPGSGIFSIDGGLLAVVLDCAGTLLAAEATALEATVHVEPTLGDRLAQRYGLLAGPAEEAEARLAGADRGVLVKETWWGYRAQQAGLLPGDLITAVDGAPVESMADLSSLLLPVSREVRELRVMRARRRRAIGMLARPAAQAGEVTQGFVSRAAGVPIDSVIPGSPADRAGARPGDRLLSVNQREPGSLDDLAEAFAASGGRPVHVVLERRGHAWGALVHPYE